MCTGLSNTSHDTLKSTKYKSTAAHQHLSPHAKSRDVGLLGVNPELSELALRQTAAAVLVDHEEEVLELVWVTNCENGEHYDKNFRKDKNNRAHTLCSPSGT